MSLHEKEYTPSAGDQFRGMMDLEDNPWSMAFAVHRDCVMLVQNSVKNFVVFGSPEDLKRIAEGCLKVAGMWERGEIPGLKVSE